MKRELTRTVRARRGWIKYGRPFACLGLFALLLQLIHATEGARASDWVLTLDASGSMWGQGEVRLEAGQSVSGVIDFGE